LAVHVKPEFKGRDGGMDATEKRRAQRFAMALPVDVKVGDLDREAAPTKTIDISSSGVYFEFPTPVDVGSSLEFLLTLPSEITKGKAVRVKCKGKVVRVDRNTGNGGKLGLAATIERYDFIREA